ncbi:hypothetical protein AB0L13_11370 [Saccharopolyspora shandongensis]|uniref:hypothetical protein n=1 Tax=Saccharopolyspora shandongensis TaxID=418495 RepID=UPI0034464B52
MELFDTTELHAAERLRRIAAEQVPGQISIDDTLIGADAAQVTDAVTGRVESVMPVSPVELFSIDEARGQLVLS